MLDLNAVGILAYAAVSALFVSQCMHEKAVKGASWDVYRVAGMIFCLFWPFLLLAVLMTLSLRRAASGRMDKSGSVQTIYVLGKRIATERSDCSFARPRSRRASI